MSQRLKLTLTVVLVVAAGIFYVRSQPKSDPRGPDDLTGKPIEVDPPLMPESPVFVGVDGFDVDGYPLRMPDRGVLRHMALSGRFDELTDWIERWQTDFEANPRLEYWPMTALDAFSTADPRLNDAINAWVASHPDSFVPHAAKGNYLGGVAAAHRGTKYASETRQEQFAEMAAFNALATKSLNKALRLRPGLAAARLQLISIAMNEGDPVAARRQMEAAVSSCPECLQIRAKYLQSLNPKWGGSIEAMRAFAANSTEHAERNPRLKALTGFVDMIECDDFRGEKLFHAAWPACDRAIAAGVSFDALITRATLLLDEDRPDESAEAFTAALKLWPGHTSTLAARARAMHLAKRTPEAANDILAALRADPFAVPAKLHQAVVGDLVWEGAHAYEAGDLTTAMERFDQALGISPYDPEARARRLKIVRDQGVNAEELERLAVRAREQPHSFGAVRDLVDALLQQERFEHATSAWGRYLAARADDPYGYFERAGAYHLWGKSDESAKDSKQACSMGLERACGGVR